MLRNIKQLYGDKLEASDGGIGHIKDFYFDDQDWVVRYLVADTGTWLPGRKVLISPHSLGRLDQAKKIPRINLTREQIEDSPAIETHQPVSRQYEEEYYKHYGWPYYWEGDGLWGMSRFPVLEMPAEPAGLESPGLNGSEPDFQEARLQSTKAIDGYLLRTGGVYRGHISDFMIDAWSWKIVQIVIKTGHRFSGKDVLIPTRCVEPISYEDSTVQATLSSAELDQLPEHELHPVGTML